MYTGIQLDCSNRRTHAFDLFRFCQIAKSGAGLESYKQHGYLDQIAGLNCHLSKLKIFISRSLHLIEIVDNTQFYSVWSWYSLLNIHEKASYEIVL